MLDTCAADLGGSMSAGCTAGPVLFADAGNGLLRKNYKTFLDRRVILPIYRRIFAL